MGDQGKAKQLGLSGLRTGLPIGSCIRHQPELFLRRLGFGHSKDN